LCDETDPFFWSSWYHASHASVDTESVLAGWIGIDEAVNDDDSQVRDYYHTAVEEHQLLYDCPMIPQVVAVLRSVCIQSRFFRNTVVSAGNTVTSALYDSSDRIIRAEWDWEVTGGSATADTNNHISGFSLMMTTNPTVSNNQPHHRTGKGKAPLTATKNSWLVPVAVFKQINNSRVIYEQQQPVVVLVGTIQCCTGWLLLCWFLCTTAAPP
jgi:hypothetical protein